MNWSITHWGIEASVSMIRSTMFFSGSGPVVCSGADCTSTGCWGAWLCSRTGADEGSCEDGACEGEDCGELGEPDGVEVIVTTGVVVGSSESLLDVTMPMPTPAAAMVTAEMAAATFRCATRRARTAKPTA